MSRPSGEGANEAVSDIGSGAGSAVEDVDKGAGPAVEDVGSGAGEAVEDVGGGAGEAVSEVGQGTGRGIIIPRPINGGAEIRREGVYPMLRENILHCSDFWCSTAFAANRRKGY